MDNTNLEAVAELSEEEIKTLADTFSYHPASPDDLAKYAAVRGAAKHFAMILMLNVPKCADRSAAIREIRIAMMTANAAIALKGKI